MLRCSPAPVNHGVDIVSSDDDGIATVIANDQPGHDVPPGPGQHVTHHHGSRFYHHRPDEHLDGEHLDDATTSSTSTTTTETPVPPQAVSQTVTAAEVIAGSLIDDGDTLGTPEATITGVVAVQGPGSLSFGVPTEVGDVNGRPCGIVTVASDGGYEFSPTLPGPYVEYTLSNAGGASTASETFQVPAPQ